MFESSFLSAMPGLKPVLAYMDPGSGSLLLQVLLGGAAGLALAFKLFWSRITSAFKPSAQKELADEENG